MTEILGRVREAMVEAGLDALLVSSAVEDSYGRHSQNRRYLSGFTGSVGLALLTAERALLAVDSRYVEQAGAEVRGFEVWPTPPDRQREWIPSLFAAAALGGRQVGVSRDDMSLAEYLVITGAAEAMAPDERPEIVPAPRILEQLRRVKTAAEVAAIERAVGIADRAHDRVVAVVAPGVTELAIAQAIEAAVRDEGGDGVSFETIVASGPRAAMPHASPTSATVREGDMLVIDMGALAGGYCSDLTRTTPVGEVSPRFSEVYEVVFFAQRAAIEGVEAGMPAAEVDRLARDVIERAGYGEAFGHGLGHGVGLQIHEAPYLGRTSEDVIEEGMVFTIEPGIYLPGWGGVRIEDVVVIEHGRARVLSQAGKLVPAGVIP